MWNFWKNFSSTPSNSPSCPRRRASHFILFLLLLLFYPGTAFAHIAQGEAGGFLSGLKHPVSGLDHVIAMIAVGLWGAQLGAPAIWVLPLAFPMVMAFGGFLGLIGIPLPGAEIAIALSGIILGIAVLLRLRWPLPVATSLIAVFAIFHGHAHGVELPPGENGILYSLGFVMGTGSLHACGILIGVLDRWNWGSKLVRAGGLAIMLTGLFFLKEALV